MRTHTHTIVIVTELGDVFSRYVMNCKVAACVTDNSSNTAKAFKEYRQQQSQSDSDEEEESAEVTFTPLHNVLPAATDGDGQSIWALLPHHICTAHTLNLTANNKVDNWLASNPESKAVNRSSTGKC